MIKVFCDECNEEIQQMRTHIKFSGEVTIDTMLRNGESGCPGKFYHLKDFSFCSVKCASDYILKIDKTKYTGDIRFDGE